MIEALMARIYAYHRRPYTPITRGMVYFHTILAVVVIALILYFKQFDTLNLAIMLLVTFIAGQMWGRYQVQQK